MFKPHAALAAIMIVMSTNSLPVLAADATACPPAASTENAAAVSTTPPAPPKIFFNELLPDPAGDDKTGEFIEISSKEQSDIFLSGVALTDSKGRSFDLKSVSVPANGLAVIPYSDSKIPLGNDGAELSLVAASGTVIDAVSYAGPVKTGWSWMRDDAGEWLWSETPTPGVKNVLTVPTAVAATSAASSLSATTTATSEPPTPDPAPPVSTAETATKPAAEPSIALSEFLPNPVGDDLDEWIEIANTSDTEVSLDGWMLDDMDGGSRPFILVTQKIAPRSVVVFTKSVTKIALNNDTDSVRLLRPDETVFEGITYEKAAEGRAYAKVAGIWQWTDLPTPGQMQNVAATVSDEPAAAVSGTTSAASNASGGSSAATAAAIEDLSGMDSGAKVTVTGTVSVAPGIIGKRLMVLQDDGSERGAIIKVSGSSPISIAAGSTIAVTGKISKTSPEVQISASAKAIRKLRGGKTISYIARNIGEIGEDEAALAVEVRGLVTNAGKKNFTLADEDARDELSVRFVGSETQLAPAVGSTVNVQGVVRYSKGKPELLVLGKSGLAVISAPTSPAAAPQPTLVMSSAEVGSPYLAYAISTLLVLAVAGCAMIWRKKRMKARAEAINDLIIEGI